MSTKVRSVLKNSGIAFGILGIATAFCFLVQRISESDTHVPLLFVLAVLFVSRFTDGYVYGIVASIIAVFGVNYVFTFPYFKLNFAITGYPLTFVAMLAVACSVSALTTQIKKQEQMRLEVEREKMRANLLRAVSHDIRTPLTSIVGSASGIIDNYDALSKENILELLEDMKSEGQWLVRMVENLLSITRIGDGTARINKEDELVDQRSDHEIQKTIPGYRGSPESAGGCSVCAYGRDPDRAGDRKSPGKLRAPRGRYDKDLVDRDGGRGPGEILC